MQVNLDPVNRLAELPSGAGPRSVTQRPRGQYCVHLREIKPRRDANPTMDALSISFGAENNMALSKAQRSKLTTKLEQRYASLIEKVRSALEKSENQQYIELIDRVPADIGDQSVGDALADLNLALIDRHIDEVRDIEAARARIMQGRFGVCIDCGQEIGFERLLAYPTANAVSSASNSESVPTFTRERQRSDRQPE
ncbi:MAG TPA: TraR/DksA family transcriptional regulator [Casimicrobiaceae bacterium]